MSTIAMLSCWTAWYVTRGAYRDLPYGKCVVREPRYVVTGKGATNVASLSTSYWLAARNIHLNGCYRVAGEDLSVDRSSHFHILFHGNGTVLARVGTFAYSQFDSAASAVPGNLDEGDGLIDLRFSKITPHAWIVETPNDHAGLCFVER